MLKVSLYCKPTGKLEWSCGVCLLLLLVLNLGAQVKFKSRERKICDIKWYYFIFVYTEKTNLFIFVHQIKQIDFNTFPAIKALTLHQIFPPSKMLLTSRVHWFSACHALSIDMPTTFQTSNHLQNKSNEMSNIYFWIIFVHLWAYGAYQFPQDNFIEQFFKIAEL